MRQRLLRHLLLRRAVVLIAAAHRAVHYDELRLMLARHRGEAVHLEVLLRRTNLAGVQPQNVDRAVAGHQFLDLPVGELDEPLPLLRLCQRVVVRIARARRQGWVPVIRTMPVGLREISADGKLLLAERVEHLAHHIRTSIGMKRHVGRCDAIIREPRIEHGKAVVVLGREHRVFHAGGFGRGGPLARVKLHRVECFRERPVIPRESGHVLAAFGPGLQVVGAPELILLDQRP